MEYWNAFKAICGRLWSAFCVLMSVSLVWYIAGKLFARITHGVPDLLGKTDAADAALRVLYAGSELAGKHTAVMHMCFWVFIALGAWSVGQVLFGYRETSFIPLARAAVLATVVLAVVGGSQWLTLRKPALSLNIANELLWNARNVGITQAADKSYVLVSAAGTRRFPVPGATRPSLEKFLQERSYALGGNNP